MQNQQEKRVNIDDLVKENILMQNIIEKNTMIVNLYNQALAMQSKIKELEAQIKN